MRTRYSSVMDHAWAADQLGDFKQYIDTLFSLASSRDEDYDNLVQEYGSKDNVVDQLVTMDRVMRELMEAALPGLGNYPDPSQADWEAHDWHYWHKSVRPNVLRAIGIHQLGVEVRKRMQPDSPDLVADQLHSWVWDAAMPLWLAGSRQEAVQAAARSVNARLQQRLGRRDVADAALCREAFSLQEPSPNRPRLRFPGDQTSETWRSRQKGGIDFGAGCFEGIRNPASHEHDLNLSDMVALEYLATFSVLARWIEECVVDHAGEGQPAKAPPGRRLDG